MSDLLMLCYHAVSPRWPADLSVTPAALEAQIGLLAARGYTSARFSDAVAGHWSNRTVVITFDDNYRSVAELAKPILDRYGYVGTVFVPTDWPDRDGPMCWPGIDRWIGTSHEQEMRSLEWRELRGLQRDGWEIGSHTCSHPQLPEIADTDLERELTESRARVEEELGAPCTSLAYPYGGVDARVEEATRAARYRAACTIPTILSAPTPLRWPRAPIFQNDDLRRFRLKVSAPIRKLRATPPGTLLDHTRVATVNALRDRRRG
ncbi:MAG TPA: polysaccharide deacetylase family protein [Solirubrobacteraceae bacterium]|nr:polysaccharide deacetylase family protein [Solirubrobacteraceae bacterium]